MPYLLVQPRSDEHLTIEALVKKLLFEAFLSTECIQLFTNMRTLSATLTHTTEQAAVMMPVCGNAPQSQQ
jgi:hypothetical protein